MHTRSMYVHRQEVRDVVTGRQRNLEHEQPHSILTSERLRENKTEHHPLIQPSVKRERERPLGTSVDFSTWLQQGGQAGGKKG